MSQKLGRNDPCHCGSGKKYKKCHLALDEAAAGQAVERSAPASESPDYNALESGLRKPSKVWRSARQRHRRRLTVQDVPEMSEYLARQGEIDAAFRESDAHWDEYAAICEDPDAFAKLEQSVIGAEVFKDLRFSAADVRRAFQQVGYPVPCMTEEMKSRIAEKAVKFLADRQVRVRVSIRLTLHMIECMAAGRYMEACFLCDMAGALLAERDEFQPVLLDLFDFGYQDWADELIAKRQTMFQEAGLDLADGGQIAPEEASAVSADAGPMREKWDRFHAALCNDPDMGGIRQAASALEKKAFVFLAEGPVLPLLLSRSELEHWLTILIERGVGMAPVDGKINPNDLENAIFPLVQEMAESIFTPERVAELVRLLNKSQQDLVTKEDHELASALNVIIEAMRFERGPKDKFLHAICGVSLMRRKEIVAAGKAVVGS